VCQFRVSDAPGLAEIRYRPSPTCHAIVHSVRTVSNDARHALGQLGEQLAADHLVHRGFRILDRNYRTRHGELDIVAYGGRTMVFCEVKTRRLAPGSGNPFDAIRSTKRSRVRKMAARWLAESRDRPYADTLRFDAIGVTFDLSGRFVSLEHLEGCF
jgi:putative endonuclease